MTITHTPAVEALLEKLAVAQRVMRQAENFLEAIRQQGMLAEHELVAARTRRDEYQALLSVALVEEKKGKP